MRRIPIIATLVVLAAVAVMIALGVWQLGRMKEKEALIGRYAAAQAMSADVPWPGDPGGMGMALFRHTRIECRKSEVDRPTAGRNLAGEAGWAHVFRCELGDGDNADVVMGWSREPALRQWSGGAVGGVIAPGGRLIADQPLPGLKASARPDPRDVPNNHWSYAAQWFLFALTALVIYALALRKRLNPPRNGEGDHPQDGGGVGS